MIVYLIDALLAQIDYEIEDVQRQLRIYARKQLTCLENDTDDIVEQLEMLEKKRVKLLGETSTLKSGLPESDETGDETLELVAKERLELLQKMAQAEEELRIEEKRAEQVGRFSVFGVGLGSTEPQCLEQYCACCIWNRLRSHVSFSQTSSILMVALCFLKKYFRHFFLRRTKMNCVVARPATRSAPETRYTKYTKLRGDENCCTSKNTSVLLSCRAKQRHCNCSNCVCGFSGLPRCMSKLSAR